MRQKFGETLVKQVYNESIFRTVKQELRPLLENELFPKFVKSELFNAKYREEFEKEEQRVHDQPSTNQSERYKIRVNKKALQKSLKNGQKVFIDDLVNPASSSGSSHFARPNNSISYPKFGSKFETNSMKSPSLTSIASLTQSNSVNFRNALST